jgi:hypothetical protein
MAFMRAKKTLWLIGLLGVLLFMVIKSEDSLFNTKADLGEINTHKDIIVNDELVTVVDAAYEPMTCVLNENNELVINMSNSPLKVQISFAKTGINSIFGLSKITYDRITENTTDFAEEEMHWELEAKTDWIGPYIMRSLENEDSQEPVFTGGWHGRKVEETEVNTAYTKEVSLSCDGNKITENELVDCQEIQISVVNYIEGYNTDYPILKEIVTYKICNGVISVYLTGIALEQLEIIKYYGLESHNCLWDGEITYYYQDDEVESYETLVASQAHNKAVNVVREYQLTSKDQRISLEVGILDKGLGTFSYLGEAEPTCFTADYGKSYYNLINGKTMVLDANDDFYWEGYYKFFQ